MDKENVVCKYTVECYSAIKKKEIMPFASPWVELEDTMLREMSKNDKYVILQGPFLFHFFFFPFILHDIWNAGVITEIWAAILDHEVKVKAVHGRTAR